jgi:hypothetical protein
MKEKLKPFKSQQNKRKKHLNTINPQKKQAAMRAGDTACCDQKNQRKNTCETSASTHPNPRHGDIKKPC